MTTQTMTRPKGRGLLLAAWLIALCLLAGCAVNPVTGQQEVVLMSESQELAMGASYYPQTTQINNGLPPRDPELQSYVSRVGHNLARVSHRPNIPWEFNVVNTDVVNAYALPGGKISLTRGLLTKMESEDEMASVLAHEIGHVTARHTVAQYTRGMFVQLAMVGVAIALADSDYAQVGMVAAGLAGGLLMLSYSRDQERQADALGYEYMVKNGYNPVGQLEAFQMMQNEHKREPGWIEAMLSSHPLTTERIQTTIQRVDATAPAITRQQLKTRDFEKAMAVQRGRAPAYAMAAKGDKLYKKKKYPEAAKAYRQAIGRFNKEGLFHAKLALAQNQMDQLDQALGSAKKGVKLSPRVFMPNFVAGGLHYKAGRLEEAKDYLQLADQLLPENARNKLVLAATYDRLGNRGMAVITYRELVRGSPKSKEARVAKKRLNSLGYR